VSPKSAALATAALSLAGASETTTTATLSLAGASETSTATLSLAGASEMTGATTLPLARLAKRLARALCGGFRLGGFRCGRSLRCLGGGSVLFLVGFFCHGCPYSFNPASRAASAKALTFP